MPNLRRIILAFSVAVLMAGLHSLPPVFAVTYAPGWNLVSGPEGSTLVGASGSLFTLQPGDTGYETFPASSPLKGGWAYWAYFPDGGSLSATADQGAYHTTLSAGQWAMIGNPSASGAAAITGADAALTYTPNGGYQNSTNIPPGQGAWVLAQSTVTLSAPVSATPAVPVAAVVAPTPAAVATTIPAAAPPSDQPLCSSGPLCQPLAVTVSVITSTTTFSLRSQGVLNLAIDVYSFGRPLDGARVVIWGEEGGFVDPKQNGTPNDLGVVNAHYTESITTCAAILCGVQWNFHVEATYSGLTASADCSYTAPS